MNYSPSPNTQKYQSVCDIFAHIFLRNEWTIPLSAVCIDNIGQECWMFAPPHQDIARLKITSSSPLIVLSGTEGVVQTTSERLHVLDFWLYKSYGWYPVAQLIIKANFHRSKPVLGCMWPLHGVTKSLPPWNCERKHLICSNLLLVWHHPAARQGFSQCKISWVDSSVV